MREAFARQTSVYTCTSSFKRLTEKGIHVEAIGNFFNWLFGTRPGVFTLLGVGVLFFLLLAWLLERRMRKQFYNHEKTEDDWDLFDDQQ